MCSPSHPPFFYILLGQVRSMNYPSLDYPALKTNSYKSLMANVQINEVLNLYFYIFHLIMTVDTFKYTNINHKTTAHMVSMQDLGENTADSKQPFLSILDVSMD